MTAVRATRELRRFLLVTGIVLIALGAASLVLGAGLHTPDGSGPPAADSDARFTGGLLLGSGLVWIHAARQVAVPAPLVRLLAAALLLGGAGRLVSLVLAGPPGPVGLVQTAVEIVVPLAVLGLLAASAGAGRRVP